MSDANTYQHWHFETDENHIIWLAIDRAGASVNSLSRDVFNEFDRVLDDIVAEKPKGLVIYSAKAKGFIAGADVSEFVTLKNSEQAFELIRKAQTTLDKLAALPCPTVAMIQGFCLGGGLELALACRYRVAEAGQSTRLGLPEVKLGIHPGWGGTVRLPKLIGVPQAMNMILTGRTLSANAAARIGVVDAAVALRELKRAALYYALEQPKVQQPNFWQGLANAPLIRKFVSKLFYKKLSSKVNKTHYPAPYAVIDNWRAHGVEGKNAYLNEAKSIAHLMMTDTSRNLVRVFFLQNQLKALAKLAKSNVEHVHVIGAGTMGGDIAAWCAYKGFYVTLQDQSPEKIAPAIKRAYQLYRKKLKKPRLIKAVMDRLQPDVKGGGVGRADVVIEAVFEDLAVKQALFKDIEPQLKSGAILATNTSSIPLEDISTVLKNPERLLGMHFFNPVSKMPLVEIVRGPKTSDELVNCAAAFVGKLARQPLPVASRPGFLVNRVLMPYLMEAMELLQEGVPAAVIDKAALTFGMPMGPITLADKVGLDVCLSVAENLTAHFGGQVPKQLTQMVENKHLGIKSGRGFYRYQNGKKILAETSQGPVENANLTDRLILRMLNEAMACLDEGVITDADLLDAGMIFGTGFAPFRGGPIHYAKARGIVEVVSQLERFSTQYGDRFKPNAGWENLVLKKTASTTSTIQEEARG